MIINNSSVFKDSRKSLANYFDWRRKRSFPAVIRVKKKVRLRKQRVLDLGCGYGSLTANLLDEGARVVGCEVDQFSLDLARKFLKGKENYELIKVSDERLPFKDKIFDVVFLLDVIEHVENPAVTISECQRVLKSGGILYVEFTPYYSIAGHHLYDYTKLPVHMLPKDKVKKMIFSKRVTGTFPATSYWEEFKKLNKIRINTFQKLVSEFEPLEEKYIIKYPDIFEINLPFIKHFNGYKDFFTTSFLGIYRKPS